MNLHIHKENNNEHQAYIENKMFEYNMLHFPDDLKGRCEVVNLFLKDADNQIYGGLVGEICWNWLEIEYLFVNEELRKSGYGKALMLEAESLAREKKCEFIKVDTLSFQALDFYKKLGFEVYGTLENAGSHTHYYLKKDL
ncbi:GNAT family N-acetyltransferase [Paenibacillus sp. GCM10012306]|uniref:GNAT family N-acetyltransferase n=1 Tax=Paenibacillus sp. GCM10012306 TaxID=3317342 RepID=UPI003622BDE1